MPAAAISSLSPSAQERSSSAQCESSVGKRRLRIGEPLESLKQVYSKYAQKHSGKDAEVVRKRWVDGGKNAQGVRTVSSGDISLVRK